MKKLLNAFWHFIAVLVALFAVPCLGAATGQFLRLNGSRVLAFGVASVDLQALGLWLLILSLFAGGLGVTLMSCMWLGAIACGENRNRLARVFGPLVRTCCAMLAILALAQAAIVLVCIVLGTESLLNTVPLGIVIPAVVAAFYGALDLAGVAARLSRPAEQYTSGEVILPQHQQRLWAKVAEIAQRLGARVPDHMIIGLEPKFFATAASIRLADDVTLLHGETIYLSASCLRLLTEPELSAVIGHELQHFSGEDTAFTLRFVPIYEGLSRALRVAYSARGLRALSMFSARSILGQSIVWFARAERTIGRKREIEADQAGARIGGALSVVTSLVRVGALNMVWPATLRYAIEKINQGDPAGNLSVVMAQAGADLLRKADRSALLNELAGVREPHPTDTHPTLQNRAAALCVPLEAVPILPGDGAAIAWDLLDDAEQLEAVLSERCCAQLIASRAAKPARDPNRPNYVQKQRMKRQAQAAARKQRLERNAGT